MGGLGSGQRGSKKPVVESCLCIDTSNLKQWNLLVPGITGGTGSFQWRRGGEAEPSSSVSYSITMEQHTGRLRLMYSMKSANANLDYTVRLVTTGCHLGGVRWWFICPLSRNEVACGRRVRKLYLLGKYFGCRRCHALSYTSCQESDSRVYAALRQGLDFDGFGDPSKMSLAQLGFSLKVVMAQRKRLEQSGRRKVTRRGATVG